MAFDKAWIGYENLFVQFQRTITGAASDVGFDPKSMGSWALWDRWKGVPGTNLVAAALDCGVAKPVDYFAVAGHNLISSATKIKLVGSNAADFSSPTVILSFDPTATAELYNGANRYNGVAYHDGTVAYWSEAPSADYVLGFSFAQVSFRYYRLEYTGGMSPIISVLSMGRKMTFERGFYSSFQPPKWNEDVETTNNKSENGVYLGRSKVRVGLKPWKIGMEPVSHAWIDDVWLPFKNHAESDPFIFAWGDIPFENRAYAWEKGFEASTVRNTRWGKVGVSCEGVAR